MRMSGNTLSVGFVSEKASRIFGNFLAGTWRDPSSPPCKVKYGFTLYTVTVTRGTCGGFILGRGTQAERGWCVRL